MSKGLHEIVIKVLSDEISMVLKVRKMSLLLLLLLVSLKPVHRVLFPLLSSPCPHSPITLSQRVRERWLAQQLANFPGFTLLFNDPFLLSLLSHLLKDRYKLYL